MTELAFALNPPAATATLRATPEDFQVDEVLGFEPDGAGDHVLLHIRKRNTNTEWLARQIAKFAAVKPVDVGYSGLKDRNAVTSQWFSVNLAGIPEPDWTQLNSDTVNVLRVARNRRKLKRGAHAANEFIITLRDVDGDTGDIERRLQSIALHGVPNYFGEQRFGIDAQNIELARALFAGERRIDDRHRRGLIFSAARSFLFNAVLSRRVADGTWNQAIAGDAFVLDGTRSFFVAADIDDDVRRRIREHDIHPSGPLWGRGDLPAQATVRELEQNTLAAHALLRDGLERAGMSQERRALRLRVHALTWTFSDARTLRLAFRLEPGSYATVVLAELVRNAQSV